MKAKVEEKKVEVLNEPKPDEEDAAERQENANDE